MKKDMEEERAEELMTQAWILDLTMGHWRQSLCVSPVLPSHLNAQLCPLHCSSCRDNECAVLKSGVLLSSGTTGLIRGEWKGRGRGMCFLAVCPTFSSPVV